MSDRLYETGSYTSIVNYGEKRRIQGEKKSGLQPTLFVLIGGSVLVVAIVLGLSITAAKTEIRGTVLISGEEILRIAGLSEHVSLFGFDAERSRTALRAYYKIKNASVGYVFPGTVVVTIEERLPVGMILAEADSGGSDLVCIDADGVIIGSESEYPGENKLPVLSGILLKNYKNGNRLDERFLPALRSLEKLKSENPKLLEAFSEFQFVEKSKGYIEVLAYPIMYRTPLRLGTTIDAATLQVGIWILDAMKDKIGEDMMAELDLRGKIYSAKFKEAVSG